MRLKYLEKKLRILKRRNHHLVKYPWLFCKRCNNVVKFPGLRNVSIQIRHCSVFPNVPSLLRNQSQIVAFHSPPALFLEVARLLTLRPLKSLRYSLPHKLTFSCIQLHPLSVPICTRNTNVSLVVKDKPYKDIYACLSLEILAYL